MTLPPWTTARVAVSGLRAAIIAALFLIVVALCIVQTVRVGGLSLCADLPVIGKVCLVDIKGWKPTAQRTAREFATFRTDVEIEQKLAAQKAAAQRIRYENRYRDLAEEADRDVEQAQALALADAERFIAANRVRSCPAGGAGIGARAAPGDHSAQGADRSGTVPVMDDRPALPSDEQLLPGFVVVPDEDVRTCSNNTVRLFAGQEWALGLERESIATREAPLPGH
ncbi:hypothetical protein [Alteriqipengyuania sp.]|uniref:hypothetical protein n=1 Tax=Alteriqipengyuania sp. TaxID=2800692 RepID=UPI0035113A53